MVSNSDGQELLKFARNVVYSKLFSKELEISQDIKKHDKKQGVFVTIHKNHELRGCIGYVIGHFPLYEGIKMAAYAAAFEDTRFPPIDKSEYDNLDFEISILTVPEEIKVGKPEELLEKIVIGKDGLIVQSGPYSGLLLPQVPTEYDWNVEEFLGCTCEKAGLEQDSWRKGKCSFSKFQAQIFKE